MNQFDQKLNSFFQNYHDAGMKKWGGFHLSEHISKLHDDTKDDSHEHLTEELTTKFWSTTRTSGRGDR